MNQDTSDFRARVRGIAEDLVQLEVNTIVKPSIMGTKMPAARHALMDIGREYFRCLCEHRGAVDAIDEERLGSYYAFDRLRTVAKAGLLEEEAAGAGGDEKWYLLQRVKDMSDHLKGVMEDVRQRGGDGWDNDYSRAEIQGKRDPAPHVLWVPYPPRVPDQVRRLLSDETDALLTVTNLSSAPLDFHLVRAPTNVALPVSPGGLLLVDGLEPIALMRDVAPLQSKALASAGGEDTIHLVPGRYLLSSAGGPIGLDLRVEAFVPPPPLPLTPDDARVIRKAWELGTEEIAMQTVIYLDGDVVTRLRPQYAGADEPLREVHQRGVTVAVGFWRDLVGIAMDLLGSVVGSLSGRR